MAVVYWIHTKDHTDMFSEGYIGISKNTAKQRFKSHKHAASRGSTYKIHNAIRKHGSDILVETLVEGTEDYCAEMENKLRPYENIGWNLSAGGRATRTGSKHTDATKNLMSVKRKALGLSKERLAKMAEARARLPKARLSDWTNPKANKDVWKSAVELHKVFSTFKSCGHKRLAKAYGVFSGDSLERITQKFNQGWVPTWDAGYLSWLNTKD